MKVPTPAEIEKDVLQEDKRMVEEALSECTKAMQKVIRSGSACFTLEWISFNACESVREILRDAGWDLDVLSKERCSDGTFEFSVEMKVLR